MDPRRRSMYRKEPFVVQQHYWFLEADVGVCAMCIVTFPFVIWM